MTTWKGVFIPLIISIIATLYVSPALSCSCPTKHPQQFVCDADFVFKGRVLGRSLLSQSPATFGGQHEYRIQVYRVFKGQVHVGSGQEVKLVTLASEALCGIAELTETKTYVITGKVKDGEMQLSVCDWVAEWESVTTAQRRAIKHRYQKYCSRCEIRTSTPAGISHPPPPGPLDYFQGCSYSMSATLQLGTSDCEAEHSICGQQHHGGCRWLGSDAYQKCVENRKIAMQLHSENQKLGYNNVNQEGDW